MPVRNNAIASLVRRKGKAKDGLVISEEFLLDGNKHALVAGEVSG